MAPQHHILKETSETLSRLLQDEFKRNGYKRVHIVEEAPKPEEIEGRLPAVCVYLYHLHLDPEGTDLTVHQEHVEVSQPDGTIKEYARRRRLWVRLEWLISAWAHEPEDEQILLALVIRTIHDRPVIFTDELFGSSFEEDFRLYFELTQRLDESTLSRFWTSLNHPVRPSLQLCATVPIIPEHMVPFTRVERRRMEYKNIVDPSPQGDSDVARSPEAPPPGAPPTTNPYPRPRLDLGGRGGKR